MHSLFLRRLISALISLAAVLVAIVAQIQLGQPAGERWGWWLYLVAAVLAAVGLSGTELDRVPRPTTPPARYSGYRAIAVGLGLLIAGLGLEVWALSRLGRLAYDLPATFGWAVGLILLLAGSWLFGRLGPWSDQSAPADPVLPITLPMWVEWGLLALILLLAIALRTYRLGQIPPGIFVDETNAALDAISIMEGRPDSPFGVGWFETPSLYAYYLVALFRLLGTTFIALKAASLIPAILTVAALYPLARLLFGPAVALVSTAFLAFARWHLTMSRWGWNEVGPPLFQLLATYFLIRATRERRARDFALAGLCLGLGMYTYLASRLVVIIVVAYLTYRIIFERGFLRRTWRGLVLFVLVYVATFAPLAQTYARNPFTFLNRSRQVSIAHDVERAGGDLALLAQPWRWRESPERTNTAWQVVRRSLVAHLKMFHLRGDFNPRHNLPGKPMLDPVTGILFVLGLGLAARRIGDHRWALLVFWPPITLLGGILSTAGEAPQGYRTLGVVPAVALLAGGALVEVTWVWARLVRAEEKKERHGDGETRRREDRTNLYVTVSPCHRVTLSPRHLRSSAQMLPRSCAPALPCPVASVAAAALAVAGWLNVSVYFGPQATDERVWVAFSPAETAVAREVAARPPTQRLYLSPRLYYFSPLRFITYRSTREGGGGLDHPPYQLIQPAEDLPLPDQGGADALFLLDVHYADLLELFTRFYPGTTAEMRRGPQGQPLYLSVTVPGEEIAALQGLNGRFILADGREIRARSGPDVTWGAGGPANGEVPVRAEWEGSLAVRRTGVYDLQGEGGLLIEVDGQSWEGPRMLGKGLHRLHMAQADPGAAGVARLLWTSPGSAPEPVPSDVLFTVEPWSHGLSGSYFEGKEWSGRPVFQQVSPVVLFAWPDPEPWPAPFSARFEGEIEAPVDGSYFFSVNADDGLRVWIDGQLIGEGVNPAGVNIVEASMPLAAGRHAIRIDYYQEGGGKALELWWAPPGQPRQVVPPSVLYPAAIGGVP